MQILFDLIVLEEISKMQRDTLSRVGINSVSVTLKCKLIYLNWIDDIMHFYEILRSWENVGAWKRFYISLSKYVNAKVYIC